MNYFTARQGCEARKAGRYGIRVLEAQHADIAHRDQAPEKQTPKRLVKKQTAQQMPSQNSPPRYNSCSGVKNMLPLTAHAKPHPKTKSSTTKYPRHLLLPHSHSLKNPAPSPRPSPAPSKTFPPFLSPSGPPGHRASQRLSATPVMHQSAHQVMKVQGRRELTASELLAARPQHTSCISRSAMFSVSSRSRSGKSCARRKRRRWRRPSQ